jgi:hypothetical protein
MDEPTVEELAGALPEIDWEPADAFQRPRR